MPEKATIEAKSIEDLLGKQGKKMRGLFLKVMNAHAGYQVNPRSDNELLADIREAIEESCDEE